MNQKRNVETCFHGKWKNMISKDEVAEMVTFSAIE